jgi:uncharacterized protein (DUF2147 family)
MKKTFIISLLMVLVAITARSQNVLGKWMTEGGDSYVEIYQAGDKVNGKIVWLRSGDGKLDSKNPDEKLRTRKLVGTDILTCLTQKKQKWEGGKIYNPKNGKTYKCAIWIEDGNLKVRGYLGVFYETQTWIRQ